MVCPDIVVLCGIVWCYVSIVALCGGPLCIHGRGLNVSLQLVLQPLSTHIHIIITIIIIIITTVILLLVTIIITITIIVIILVINAQAPVFYLPTSLSWSIIHNISLALYLNEI